MNLVGWIISVLIAIAIVLALAAMLSLHIVEERHRAERSCRICGCTNDNACRPNSCWWIEDDLCSECEEAAAALSSFEGHR